MRVQNGTPDEIWQKLKRACWKRLKFGKGRSSKYEAEAESVKRLAMASNAMAWA